MTENIDFDSEVWGDTEIPLQYGFITEEPFFTNVVEKEGESKWQDLVKKTMSR